MNTLVRPEGITVCSYDAVEIAYSGVKLGNTAEKLETVPGEAALNLKMLRSAVGIGHHTLIRAQQKDKFLDLSGIPLEELKTGYATDGIFTDSSDVAVSILPADCTVMVFHSADGDKSMGVIHGGYLGIHGDIHLAALELYTGRHGVRKNAVRIFFAPQIRSSSYFFENIHPEQLADRRWARHIYVDNYGDSEVFHIDLLSRIVTDLTANGIDPTQLDISPVDTGSDLAYFSHARSMRTGEREGRNGLVAKLKQHSAA